ncbi:Cna B-type domain-containing protein [Granulicatella balaenopterae]|nr:Cna B-type domain-containing protein [Granulicatella balaenopterae]
MAIDSNYHRIEAQNQELDKTVSVTRELTHKQKEENQQQDEGVGINLTWKTDMRKDMDVTVEILADNQVIDEIHFAKSEEDLENADFYNFMWLDDKYENAHLPNGFDDPGKEYSIRVTAKNRWNIIIDEASYYTQEGTKPMIDIHLRAEEKNILWGIVQLEWMDLDKNMIPSEDIPLDEVQGMIIDEEVNTKYPILLKKSNNWRSKYEILLDSDDRVSPYFDFPAVHGFYPILNGLAVEGSWGGDNEYNLKVQYTQIWRDLYINQIWKNEDGSIIKPEDVPFEEMTAKLMIDGYSTGEELVLKKSENWQGVFKDLYIRPDGVDCEYTIKVNQIYGFENQISKTSLNGIDKWHITSTNTKIPGIQVSRDLHVSQIWKYRDGSIVNPEDVPVEEVTVTLLKNGFSTGKELVLKKSENWQGEFKNLLVKESGIFNQYAIKINQVEGFDNQTTIPILDETDNWQITSTNTALPIFSNKIKCTVKPIVWLNSDNNLIQANDVPVEEVTVSLLADGIETGKVVTLKRSTNWQGEFNNLRNAHFDGSKIKYSIKVHPVKGFTVEVGEVIDLNHLEPDILNRVSKMVRAVTSPGGGGSSGGGGISLPNYAVTITAKQTSRDLFIQKSWCDSNGDAMPLADIPIEEVTVSLLANGIETGKVLTLNSSNNWQGEFTDLAIKDTSGKNIIYSIKESEVPGFHSNITGNPIDGFVVTNTATISIPVEKVWIGKAAKEVVINLFADGKQVKELTLNATNDWKGEFNNLPVYNQETGKEIAYSIAEVNIDGYTSNITKKGAGYVITNINTATISIPVEKVWIGKPAEEVVINLFADGTKVKDLILNASNNWKAEFNNLPVYNQETGNKIVYSIAEVNIDGYTSNITKKGAGYVITNINTATISIPVEKVWIGKAAKEVVINLFADGTKVKDLILNASNNRKAEFNNLPVYNQETGKEIAYSIEEVNIDGYTSNITKKGAGYVITNINTATISIPVEKVWIGKPAKEVVINLLADGTKVQELTLNATNSWKGEFEDLAKYDSTDGHEIVYSIEEVNIDGYTSKITKNGAGYVVTNTNTAKIAIPVEKVWIGKPVEEVVINLFADGKQVKDLILNASNNRKAEFNNLPVYNQETGKEIAYSIAEVAISGYTSVITGDVQNGFVVTNIQEEPPTPTVKYRDIPVEKHWIGEAAEEVVINLLADGKATGKELILNASNNWQGDFKDLAKYDSTDGHEIIYTIEEVAISGYTSAITGDVQNGFVVTNTKPSQPAKPAKPDKPSQPNKTNLPITGTKAYTSQIMIAVVLVIIGGGTIYHKKHKK